eukprot:scaffold65819_cov58-Cyclotella_meneghiniana.AAC.2
MVNNALIEEKEKLKVSISDLVGDEDMETELWRDCPDERRISTVFKASLQRPSVLREISVFEMKIIDDDDSEDGELKSSSEEAHIMASQPQDPPLHENSPTTKDADSGCTLFGVGVFLGIITVLYLLFFNPVITVIVVTVLIVAAKQYCDYKYYNRKASKRE